MKNKKFKSIARYALLSMWLLLACVGIGLAGVAPIERKRRHDELNIKPKTEIQVQKHKNDEKLMKNE